ncbi:UBN2_3 domain-containing protein [Fagus crenata]
MVISWLFNSLVPDLHDNVAYADTAQEMWADLEERFCQGNAPRVHELKRDLALMRQDRLSIAAYYTKMKGIWDTLSNYSTIPQCTCGIAKEFILERDKEKAHQFLMGLTDAFHMVRSQILNTEPLPSPNKVYALVTPEEKQLQVNASQTPIIDAAALHATNASSWTTRGITKSKDRCAHYKKLGHTKNKCFALVGYPPNLQPHRTFDHNITQSYGGGHTA